MTTTDDNHTPALLSAARLAEIRAAALVAPADLYAEGDPGATCDECGEHVGGDGAAILRTPGGGGALLVLDGDNALATMDFHREARAMVMGLLAHLDALTPRDVDGEALGREAFEEASKSFPEIVSSWDDLLPMVRASYTASAVALEARGYKRGLADGDAERTAIHCLARAEAQSAAEHATEQANALAKLGATIARLTAELAEARADTARVEAALNSSIRAYHEQVEEKASLLAAARLDGARVEREECISDMRGECDGEEDREFMIRAAERIIRRAHAAADRTTEGRQGS